MRTRIALVLLALFALAVAVWLALVDSRGAVPGAAAAPGGDRGAPATASAPAPRGENGAVPDGEAPAQPRAATRVDSIECRVLREDTRDPLEGYTLTLRCGADVHERQSNARGACVFPRPSLGRAVVWIDAPYGWVVRDPVRVLEPGGEAPRLEFLARPAGFARWRARLVDELTLEPVPHYLLRVGTRDGQRESATSDGQGRVVTEREYPPSTLLVWGYDVIGPDPSAFAQRPDFYRELEHRVGTGEAPEVELAIPVGPTYRLALEAPPDVDRERLTADLWRSPPEQRLPPERGSVPVRWNDGPWVRFEPRARVWSEERADRYLLVVAADGLHAGGASVDAARGVFPRVVPIALEARARIVGRAIEPDGEPVARASIQIARRDSESPAVAIGTDESSGNGVFEFRGLPLGAYEIHGVSAAHARGALAVEVALAERIDVEIVLPRARDAGAISGRVTAPLDSGVGTVEVGALSVRPSGRRFTQRVELRPADTALAGVFRFEHVAEGDYEVRVTSFAGDLSPRPDSIEVAPPAADVALALVPPASPRVLEWRVVDAATGAEVAETRAVFESPRMRTAYSAHAAPSRWAELEGDFDPEDRWWVCAPGYAAYSGFPARDFESDGEVWRAKVALERGFGCEVEVLGPRSAPIAGAELWLDGVRVGVTDVDGRVAARRERAPTAIALRYREWIVEPGDRADLIDALAGRCPRPRIRMSPP